ncbi:MAG TPA: hypothetical protein VJU78_06355 [Chitinophagaceae bacterium]|nr:hypothetical protein [Chitinophagaceae bacterium]
MTNAILTGDIVNSTELPVTEEKKLVQLFKRLSEPYIIEFFRGDSFQVYFKDASQSLKLALLFRCAAKRVEIPGDAKFDVRTSIGLGAVERPVRLLATAKGEAFLLSGRAFDGMPDSGKRLVIVSASEVINAGLDILSSYIDTLFKAMTAKQASTIFELISGYTQAESAKRLKKSQATVNQHAQGANWTEIKNLLDKFEQLIKLLPS